MESINISVKLIGETVTPVPTPVTPDPTPAPVTKPAAPAKKGTTLTVSSKKLKAKTALKKQLKKKSIGYVKTWKIK